MWPSQEAVRVAALALLPIASIAFLFTRFWRLSVDGTAKIKNGTVVVDLIFEARQIRCLSKRARAPRFNIAIYITLRRGS